MGYENSAQGRCKRHANHKQSTGVCSSCLRERLSHLACRTTNYTTNTTMSAASYCYYSNSSSSETSPPYASKSFHHRNNSDVMASMASGNIDRELTKSRSIAFVPKGRVGEAKFEKKKHGFWSKLLNLKGKRMDKGAHRGYACTERFY